jgi:hypothetical protein
MNVLCTFLYCASFVCREAEERERVREMLKKLRRNRYKHVHWITSNSNLLPANPNDVAYKNSTTSSTMLDAIRIMVPRKCYLHSCYRTCIPSFVPM